MMETGTTGTGIKSLLVLLPKIPQTMEGLRGYCPPLAVLSKPTSTHSPLPADWACDLWASGLVISEFQDVGRETL